MSPTLVDDHLKPFDKRIYRMRGKAHPFGQFIDHFFLNLKEFITSDAPDLIVSFVVICNLRIRSTAFPSLSSTK